MPTMNSCRCCIGMLLAITAVVSARSRCDEPPCTPDVLLFGSFNGSSANTTTTHWLTVNDAKSTAMFSSGVFSGSVGIAGFAMAQTNLLQFPATWGCRGLIINAKTSSVNVYAGYRLSFGTGDYEYHLPAGTYSSPGYKTNFTVGGLAFEDSYLDLLDFSRGWPAPGQPPWPDCHHDTSVCPTFMAMQNIQRLQVWAEGVPATKFELEIQSIRASSCYQPSELAEGLVAEAGGV